MIINIFRFLRLTPIVIVSVIMCQTLWLEINAYAGDVKTKSKQVSTFVTNNSAESIDGTINDYAFFCAYFHAGFDELSKRTESIMHKHGIKIKEESGSTPKGYDCTVEQGEGQFNQHLVFHEKWVDVYNCFHGLNSRGDFPVIKFRKGVITLSLTAKSPGAPVKVNLYFKDGTEANVGNKVYVYNKNKWRPE